MSIALRNDMPKEMQNQILLKPFKSICKCMTNTTIGSQTTLNYLLDDIVANKSGYFYSQVGIYKDQRQPSKKGGWPMQKSK